jgi:hypothetical protein
MLDYLVSWFQQLPLIPTSMTTTSTEATPKILLKEQKSRSTYKTTHKGSRASLYVPMNMRKRGKGRSAFAK